VASKTRLIERVKALDASAVDAALTESPELLAHREPRGWTWLHLACRREVEDDAVRAAASIETAKVLLRHGLDLNEAAFTEGSWRATPLWCAIGRGRNLPLARFLLEQGSDPEHCLWAAAYARDVAAIELLVSFGASLDPYAEGETPFLFAVSWSHFEAAECLLRRGADPNARDEKGRTALHMMIKKGSDPAHLRMVIGYGARLDIPGSDGLTAADLLRRKRDPQLRALAGTAAD
jgi:ankyrin repeat protein